LENEGEKKSGEGAGNLTCRTRGSRRCWNLRNGVFVVAPVLTAKADLSPENCVAVIVVVVQAVVLYFPAAVPVLFAGCTVVTKMIYVLSATVAADNLCGIVPLPINLDEVFLEHATTIVFATGYNIILRIGKIVAEWNICDLFHFSIEPILLVAAAVAFGAFWTRGCSIGWVWNRQVRKVVITQIAVTEARFSSSYLGVIDCVSAYIVAGVLVSFAQNLHLNIKSMGKISLASVERKHIDRH